MKKVTAPSIMKKKGREKIVMVTCYDYTMARLLEKSEVDSILVGDSLGMVIKGDVDTLSVTTEEIAYHVSCVRKGAEKPFLIADMPFGSYQNSDENGIMNAINLIKAGAEAVKLEGGKEIIPLVKKLTSYGIPVVGHLGMTPQHLHSFGGFKMQGKKKDQKKRIFEDAHELSDAGAVMIVLESIPASLAGKISSDISAPTIGIGAGPWNDGQVLVIQDILGMNESFVPSFVKQYMQLHQDIPCAIKQFSKDVKNGQFPESE